MLWTPTLWPSVEIKALGSKHFFCLLIIIYMNQLNVPYLLITCHFYFSDCYFWHSYFTGCCFSSTFNGCLILRFPIFLSTWDADGHNNEFISYVEKQIIWIVLTEKEKQKHSLKLRVMFYLIILLRTVAWDSASQTALRNCSKEIREDPGYRGVFVGDKYNV